MTTHRKYKTNSLPAWTRKLHATTRCTHGLPTHFHPAAVDPLTCEVIGEKLPSHQLPGLLPEHECLPRFCLAAGLLNYGFKCVNVYPEARLVCQLENITVVAGCEQFFMVCCTHDFAQHLAC